MTPDLFGEPIVPGFEYRPELLSVDEERLLLAALPSLPFQAFEFHGFEGKRRVVSFGWKYDFSAQRLVEAEPIPDFVLGTRDRVAETFGRPRQALQQLLVTEYGPGAAIGWHKDKATFDEVMGVSLAATCTLRLRRPAGEKWERRSLVLEPRSAYVLSGEVRTGWEHSIPPVAETRYSLTFRTLADRT